MDKLVALPIPGESFLLRRDNKNILIDGGYGSRALSTALSSPAIAVSNLHIVVCTHADKDHAGGLTNILDNSTVRIEEFWLPGAWSDVLPDLLQNPHSVVNSLVKEFENSHWEMELDLDENEENFESRIHAHVARLRYEIHRRDVRRDVDDSAHTDKNQLDPSSGQDWLKKQAEEVKFNREYDVFSAMAFSSGRSRIRYRAAKNKKGAQSTAFWLDIINTAERIRKIAVQAIRHGCKVRWFDFGEFSKTRQASGGEPGLLVPLNAVELIAPPARLNLMAYMLKLTPVNEESLVFYSPNPTAIFDSGVVFTADSPLGDGIGYHNNFITLPATIAPSVIATAPHHGSESNAMAYKHLQSKADVVLWLRSGGSSSHPGATFRKLSSCTRACTHCPHLGLKRQIAEVHINPAFPWSIIRVNSHSCFC